MMTLYRVAPKDVYDFLKVIWPTYDNELDGEVLSLIVATLADPDCTKWLAENLGHGNQERLDYLEQTYGWLEGEDLPDWLGLTENRLLLIKELLERI